MAITVTQEVVAEAVVVAAEAVAVEAAGAAGEAVVVVVAVKPIQARHSGLGT